MIEARASYVESRAGYCHRYFGAGRKWPNTPRDSYSVAVGHSAAVW